MSAPTYFKDAADYRDWWFYSCTALGASSPGETFEMLHQQLSEAGANAVIAARFLEENDRGIDPQLWRRAFVFGQAGLHVSLTSRALEAIGADGIVKALQSPPGEPSLVALVEEMLRSGKYKTWEIPKVVQGIREDIAAGTSHVVSELPEKLRAMVPPAQPRPAEVVESLEDLGRRLDAYVAAHQDELARDVASYGDPRRHPDFDPGRAREDRAQRIKGLNYQQYQNKEIDGIRNHLKKLKALALSEPPVSPRLNEAMRRVLRDYKEFAKHPREGRTPEVESWLREVERYREEPIPMCSRRRRARTSV